MFVAFNERLLRGISKRDQLEAILPFSPDETWVAFDTAAMADLAVVFGFFPSTSQARKNGWGGEIPDGYSERVFGKSRIRIVVMNTYPHWDNEYWWSDDNVEHPPTKSIYEWIQKGRP